jgi:hypothetical protein
VVQAIALADRKVVDAGNAASHQAALVKLPILVAERPKPVAAVVMPLIGETYRDVVLAVDLCFFTKRARYALRRLLPTIVMMDRRAHQD